MYTSDIVVDKSEETVAVLKNGNFQNVLSGEGIKNEVAIVTDKRLYYSNEKGIINIISRNEKINLDDITGTKISERNPFGLVILCIIVVFIGIILRQSSVLFSCIFLALIILVIYFATHKKQIIIEYAGGKINFSLIGYKRENIVNFINAIYREKDKIKSSVISASNVGSDSVMCNPNP